MELAQICSAMETLSLGSIDMGNLKALVSIDGRMEVSILESFSMDSNMGRASGGRMRAGIAISLMESISMIRNMGMGCSCGRVAMSSKAITRKMREMAMEKCIGLMDLSIKEIGSRVFNMDSGNSLCLMEQSRKADSRTMCIEVSLRVRKLGQRRLIE